MRYSQLLNELKVYNKEALENDDFHIFYNKSNGEVLVLSYELADVDESTLESFFQDYYEESMDLYDLVDIATDEMDENDYQYFNVSNNRIQLGSLDHMEPNSVLNKALQKIVKQLNLDGIDYDSDMMDVDGNTEDIQQPYSRSEVINASVSTTKFYHGTDYKSLIRIAKVGITGNNRTNYENIEHDEKVFFTTKLDKAAYHAINAAEHSNTVPVILELKVPDVSRLVLDYDVAINHYGIDHPLTVALGYDMIHHEATKGNSWIVTKVDDDTKEEWEKLADKSSLNTKSGIFGYVGRIPPNHITGIFIDEESAAMYELHYSEFKEIIGTGYVEMMKNGLNGKFSSFKEMNHDIQELVDEYSDFDDEDE